MSRILILFNSAANNGKGGEQSKKVEEYLQGEYVYEDITKIEVLRLMTKLSYVVAMAPYQDLPMILRTWNSGIQFIFIHVEAAMIFIEKLEIWRIRFH